MEERNYDHFCSECNAVVPLTELHGKADCPKCGATGGNLNTFYCPKCDIPVFGEVCETCGTDYSIPVRDDIAEVFYCLSCDKYFTYDEYYALPNYKCDGCGRHVIRIAAAFLPVLREIESLGLRISEAFYSSLHRPLLRSNGQATYGKGDYGSFPSACFSVHFTERYSRALFRELPEGLEYVTDNWAHTILACCQRYEHARGKHHPTFEEEAYLSRYIDYVLDQLRLWLDNINKEAFAAVSTLAGTETFKR